MKYVVKAGTVATLKEGKLVIVEEGDTVELNKTQAVAFASKIMTIEAYKAQLEAQVEAEREMAERRERAAANAEAQKERQGVTPPSDPVVKPEGDALIDAITSAIANLGEDGFNSDGKTPNVGALEAALGYGIGAEERDAAVKAMGGE